MDGTVLIVVFDVLFCVVPLALVGAGALVYDWVQRGRTRVGGNYRCRRCGFVFPSKNALVSGFESHRYGLHVDCSRCGCVVEQFVETKSK
jgi:hypothetical protein